MCREPTSSTSLLVNLPNKTFWGISCAPKEDWDAQEALEVYI